VHMPRNYSDKGFANSPISTNALVGTNPRRVPLPDCANPELRKSEGDLFLCRKARNRPPFWEEMSSPLQPPWTVGRAGDLLLKEARECWDQHECLHTN
jgi:hypothetical protein